jgi:beta-carotene 3-hydroxylase
MNIVINLLLFLVGLVGMEIVAYLTHKYLMHGPLWVLHKDHHVDHEGHLEKNDWFGLIFALPAIYLIYLGTHGNPPLLWLGLGMTAYGAFYFGFHDIIVHRRIETPLRPKSPEYVKRLVQAHKIHHWTKTRDGAVSFGFLYAPPIEKLRQQVKEIQAAQPTEAEASSRG